MSIATISPNMAAAIGHVPKVRTVRVECDWSDLAPAEGAEPLWADIEDITFEDQESIPYGLQFVYRSVWEAIWPFVHAWNATGRNRETKQRELLPPPSEAGPEVFGKCDKMITQWLAMQLKFGHLKSRALDEKKVPTSDSPAPANDGNASSSPAPNSTNGTKKKGGRSTNARPTSTS